MPSGKRKRVVGVVLFPDFELLDVAGPLECFGNLTDRFDVQLLGADRGPIRSAQGPELVATRSFADAEAVDIVLVPGGSGTRSLVEDTGFLNRLADLGERASLVTSVCTGSGLLAAAGLLDGHRATSNKRAFGWARSQGSDVDWVPRARWVVDGDRWTSSGVAAGLDMTLALIAELHGEDTAEELATAIEHDWHRDADWDPFAARNGLVDD